MIPARNDILTKNQGHSPPQTKPNQTKQQQLKKYRFW